jgi:long-chain acyl-CoA synthetase
MVRENLVEFFRDYFASPSEYLVYDDGFRRWKYSYAETARAARVFAGRLRRVGVAKGDRVILWSENRPEWLFAFWGILLAGAVVVPVGGEASLEFVRKVQAVAGAKLFALGAEVKGDAQSLGDLPVSELAEEDWRGDDRFHPPTIHRDDLAEIVFTSGSTGDPKGVQITHGNFLSQGEAAEPAARRYRGLARPLAPVRMLQMLPLSHMFGQATTLLLAPLIPASVVMLRQQSPSEIPRQTRNLKIACGIVVPRGLDLLRTRILQLAPEAAGAGKDRSMLPVRIWKYRRVHREFGWRFLGFMVGGAALDPQLERFWSRLGFLVMQGYGMTETSPVITLNHPLRPRIGSAGIPYPGVEVRIAADSEILVRGPNVTPGYYNDPGKTAETIRDGWLHTGDLGEMDGKGRLYIRGRKKDAIMTPEGLNIHPEDVERVLDAQPGVRESVVIGVPPVGDGAQEQVYAVLLMEQGADAEAAVRGANRQLEGYQRIRDFSVWSERALPRTESTGKVKRQEVRQRILARRAGQRETAIPPPEVKCGPELVELELEHRVGRKVSDGMRLDELGLGSIDEVELLLEFERRCDHGMDEAEFSAAQTVGELKAIVERAMAGKMESSQPLIRFPSWNRGWAARGVRRANLALWMLPLARWLLRPSISGVENLESLEPPVIFAANHQSHLDTPLILLALPERWRYRIAPAMFKEYFTPHFSPEGYSVWRRALSSLEYYLVALMFNAFPIPQQETGTRESFRYAGDLLGDGWSLLIYPEGERRPGGNMAGFRPGVGLLASRFKVPVVPIHLEGVDRVLPRGHARLRPGPTRVAFGHPLCLREGDPQTLAGRVENAVRALSGAG